MMKTKLFIQFVMLMAMLFLVSCVGTVKDADPITTKASASQDSSVQDFLGVNSVKAVADSKVEVYFAPISGDSDKIAYVIHYGGQVNSIYVQASSLRPDYRGLLKYTIPGLQADTQYDFNVQARNITTGAESTNNASKNARTFSNATAIFDGIIQVRNLAGGDGLNGIEVFWNEAVALGGSISKKEIDPIEYKVTVINSASLNPGNMNDLSFSEPIRKVFSISSTKRSAVINGLLQGQKYYVQVRCLHFGSSLNSADPNYLVEQNTNYLEISTYTDDLANVDFDNSSFTSTFPPGAGGLYSINTQWKVPVGNFDHYRIYYVKHGGTNLQSFLNSASLKSFCFGPETSDPSVSCEYADSKYSAYSLTGLAPYTQYDMILAVCLNANCDKSKRVLSNLRLHTTTPGVAHFTGISSTGVATSLGEIDKLFLTYTAPDFSTGNISGLLVDYYGSDPTNESPIVLNDPDVPNTSVLSVDVFDYLANTTLSVSGVNPSSVLPYCFLVYPFTYNQDGSKTTYKTGLTPKCLTPAITGPSALDFTGIILNPSCGTGADKSAGLSWSKPSSGVFDKYEFYYIKTNGAFNYGSAIADTNQVSYHKIVLNSTQTSITLTDLAPNSTYKFGVLTNFTSMYGIVRSEFNTGTKTCTFGN